MSDPTNHHHVPQFLLAGWCGADGRLTVYSRRAGRIVVNQRSPKHTGFEPHLYSVPALHPKDRNTIERGMMRTIDKMGADILRRLIAGEVDSLGEDDRVSWTLFMEAQIWRS